MLILLLFYIASNAPLLLPYINYREWWRLEQQRLEWRDAHWKKTTCPCKKSLEAKAGSKDRSLTAGCQIKSLKLWRQTAQSPSRIPMTKRPTQGLDLDASWSTTRPRSLQGNNFANSLSLADYEYKFSFIV